MAYASANVLAAEVAAKALGYHWFLGQNHARLYNVLPQWRTGGSWAAGVDVTDPNFPTKRCMDGYGAFYTRPDLATVLATGTIHLLFDLTAATTRGIDSAVITMDLRGCGDNINASIWFSDTNDFTGGTAVNSSSDILVTGNGTPGTNTGNYKLVISNLGTPGPLVNQRITNVRYMRLRLLRTAGNFIGSPLISEVAVGTRRQLAHLPIMPHDDQRRYSEVTDFIAQSGLDQRVVRNRGSQPFDFNIPMADGGGFAGVDEVTNVRSFYSDIEDGTRTFYLVDQPISGTSARALQCRMVVPELGIPKLGPTLRDMETMRFRELPPFRTTEIAV